MKFGRDFKVFYVTSLFFIVFLLVFSGIYTPDLKINFSSCYFSYRVPRNVSSHGYYIPGSDGDNQESGRILQHIEPVGKVTASSLAGEEVDDEYINREELQAVVIPALTAALATWPKIGAGQDMSKEVRENVKVNSDGIAVYAAMNALWAMSKKFNIVFVTESSEGGKDKSFDIPMGTIITSEGYISEKLCNQQIGHLPNSVDEVLDLVMDLTGQEPNYVVAINYDPVENTNAHVDGKNDSYSLMGATFYPVDRQRITDEIEDAKIHYIPDKGFYLAGYSWTSADVRDRDIHVWDTASLAVKKVAGNNLDSYRASFLGERFRHDGIKNQLIKLIDSERLITPSDGDAILRVLASSGGIPGVGSLIALGASGTSEAAIAYKTAMMFNNGHAVLTYVPSSVNKTDLSDFLENNKGSSKFTSDQANRLRSLDIDESHYLAEFSSDRAYLPAGAFNITVFTPITKASEEIVGFQMSNLLKGVSSSISSNPEEARASKQGSPIDAQALVAVKFPEDSDGRMFVLNLPYYTNNIGAFIRDVDNRLAPFVTRMSVSDKERNNVIPPVTIEK